MKYISPNRAPSSTRSARGGPKFKNLHQ